MVTGTEMGAKCFEGGERGPRQRNTGGYWTLKKVEEADSLLTLPEETIPANTLTSVQ